MTDVLAIVDRLVAAYNAKDFDTVESLLAPHLDFAHFNRAFAFDNRVSAIAAIRQFADTIAPDRKMEPAERVTAAGTVVVREAYYSGTAKFAIPDLAPKGPFRFKFCSVFRFDDAGLIVEWKDYG